MICFLLLMAELEALAHIFQIEGLCRLALQSCSSDELIVYGNLAFENKVLHNSIALCSSTIEIEK